MDIDVDAVVEEAMKAAEAVEEQKVPEFDLEKFRYDGPWPEEIPDEKDCFVYNGGASTVKELLTGNTQPVLAIRRDVWEEVRYMVRRTPNTELACFLILKRFDSLVPKYLAVDMFFPKQETGATGVSIDGQSVNSFYETLHTHKDYANHMHCRICHLHSHAGMATFWSAADTNQQMSRNDLGFYDSFRFYCVVNTKDELRCAFVQYEPFLRRFDNIPVVIVGKPLELSDERKAELDMWMAERTSKLTTDVFKDLEYFDDLVTEVYTPKVAPPPSKFAPADYFRDEDYLYDEPPITKARRTKYGKQKRYGGTGGRFGTTAAWWARRGVAEMLADYFVRGFRRRSMVSDRDVRDFMDALLEIGTESSMELHDYMNGDQSPLRRRDVVGGAAEFVGTEYTDIGEMAVVVVEWIDWIKEQEENLKRVAPFVKMMM